MAAKTRLYKTSDGAVFGGVCKGFSEVYDMDVSMVRIVYILLTFFVVGSPLILYIILWLVLPDKKEVIRGVNKDALSDDYTINDDEYKY